MIVYPGNIQGRSIKETGAKGCYIVDVDEAGRSTLQFHELDFVRWQVRDLSIEGLSNEAEWIQKVEQVIEDIRAELPELMSVVRFRLIGRGDVHKVLAEKGAAEDLLSELQRREAIRAERKDYKGLVWTEGFAIESGLAIDRQRLLEEDSFLGEMLRIAEHTEHSPEALEELLNSALKPLLENQELRKLLSMTSQEEKLSWLRGSAEQGITMLGGMDDTVEAAESLSYQQAGGQNDEN